jgi:hypothetical protein
MLRLTPPSPDHFTGSRGCAPTRLAALGASWQLPGPDSHWLATTSFSLSVQAKAPYLQLAGLTNGPARA